MMQRSPVIRFHLCVGLLPTWSRTTSCGLLLSSAFFLPTVHHVGVLVVVVDSAHQNATELPASVFREGAPAVAKAAAGRGRGTACSTPRPRPRRSPARLPGNRRRPPRWSGTHPDSAGRCSSRSDRRDRSCTGMRSRGRACAPRPRALVHLAGVRGDAH